MANVYNIYTKLNKQDVIGALKATGSRDKDILYHTKDDLLKVGRQTRFCGTIFLIAGIGFTILILTSPIGIPMAIAGWFWRRRGTTSIAAVETAYKEYTAGL